MRRCGFVGTDVGGEFSGWSQSTLIFTALVPLLLSVQSLSVRRAAVLSWLSGMVFMDFVIVVLANDKHGGCVGV